MIFDRFFDMPNKDTFTIPAVREFVLHYLRESKVCSVDPFARNCKLASVTNDINPETRASYHLDARVFLQKLHEDGIQSDLVILDPPYSPRQITEHYAEAGIKATATDTQSCLFMSEVHDGVRKILRVGGYVITCGWNSNTLGPEFTIERLRLVNHGGTHYDTILTAQRRTRMQLPLEFPTGDAPD